MHHRRRRRNSTDKISKVIRYLYSVVTFLNIFFFRLYDKIGETDNAASAFTEYCLKDDDFKDRPYEEQAEFFAALQYLANYHLKRGELDDAYIYAYKCLECDEVLFFLS